MNEEAERRIGRNESLFRQTNEAIERGQWHDDLSKVVRFRCECASLSCNQAVELSLTDYERVRQSPRRFLVVPGHERSEIETVVDRQDGYVVVEKEDAAGEVAATTDPRD